MKRAIGAEAVSTPLLIGVNAALYLFAAELLNCVLRAGFSYHAALYIFSILFLGGLLFGLVSAVLVSSDNALTRRFSASPLLPYVTAVSLTLPQVFVTSHMLRAVGTNTYLSLAVLAATLFAVAYTIHRFKLGDWLLPPVSLVSGLLCVYTLHSDFSLARVSEERLDLYFVYTHALPFVSLMLTISLYAALRHRRNVGVPLPVSVSALLLGLLLLYGLLPRLPINSPELESYLIFSFLALVVLGCARLRVVRLLRIAAPIWALALAAALFLAFFATEKLGTVWSLTHSTVLTASTVKQLGLFDTSFNATLNRIKRQPEYKMGKRTVMTAVKWNRKYAAGKPTDLSVLLITIDAFRYDSLGRFRGAKKSFTPNLDELLARSTYFESTYAQGGWTSISLPSLIWSKYPRLMKFIPLYEDNKLKLHLTRSIPRGRRIKYRFQSPLREPDVNIGRFLRRCGYRTYAVTNDDKTSYFNPKLGFARGFKKILYPKTVRSRMDETEREMNLDAVATKTVIETIEAPEDKPFFIWTHLFAPHSRYTPPPGYDIPFEGYDGEVYFADMMVGRILDALKREKKDRSTIVIVTGDHGESFGEHQYKFHGKELYDHAMRVPLLVHLPGQTAPKVIRTPVGLIDIIPTIVDAVGEKIPSSMQGLTLLPAIRGGAAEFERPPVYLETWKDRVSGTRTLDLIAVVHDHHKLIMDTLEKTFSLYDLKHDPKETANLLEHPSVKTDKLFYRLGGYLLGWRDIDRGH